MTPPILTGACPRCGASWTYLNVHWLWKDKHGRTGLQLDTRDPFEEGPPPLTACLVCKQHLKPVGKARVEEVKGK